MKVYFNALYSKLTPRRSDNKNTQTTSNYNHSYHYNHNYDCYKNNFEGNSISFGTLIRRNHLNLSEDTAFFRDLGTLNAAVDILKSNFPDGAEILDYAASDGQEALSILALLGKDREKFDIKAFDTSYHLISHAKNGCYSIINGYWDDFLINFFKSKSERKATRAFNKIMKKDIIDCGNSLEHNNAIRSRDYECNNFYNVRPKYANAIKYDVGSIENIDEIGSKKQAGAVFFRNAFYHVFRPMDPDSPIKSYNHEQYREMSYDEIVEKSNEIIGKVDKILKPGGIFVMGDVIHEHLIKVNKNDNCDKIKVFDAYGNINSSGTLDNDSFIAKESPIVKALQDRGFQPVYTGKCLLKKGFTQEDSKYIDVPTIWQKPED